MRPKNVRQMLPSPTPVGPPLPPQPSSSRTYNDRQPHRGASGGFGNPVPLAPGAVAALFSSSVAPRQTTGLSSSTSTQSYSNSYQQPLNYQYQQGPAPPPRHQNTQQQPRPPAPARAPAPAPQTLVCRPCDRSFTAHSQLQAHLATHVSCSTCSFKAAKKVVTLHEEEIHGKVEIVDVPPQYRPGKLETPEEIAKWREERKKNYPTEANIAKKKEEQAAKLAEERKRKREEEEERRQREGPLSKSSSGPQICSYFARGRCNKGASCRFRHERPAASASASSANMPPEPFRSLFPPAPLAGPGGKRRPLLQALLERDVRKERALLLQCVRYVVANDFFRGVEMPLEKKQEEEEERKLVEIISGQDEEKDLNEDGNGGEEEQELVVEQKTDKIELPKKASEPAKPQSTLSALPLADYGESSSESEEDDDDDDEEEVNVRTHAFALGGPIVTKKPRVEPKEPVFRDNDDEDDEVDFEV